MFAFYLFAQPARPGGSPLDRPEILYGTAGLVGALLAGAVVLWLIDRWRKRAAMEDRESGTELTDFRAMYERGEITEAEYNRLRLKVADRVKKPPPAPPAGMPLPPGGSVPPPAPPVPGPFPPGYFDDPPPPPAPGGTAPPA